MKTDRQQTFPDFRAWLEQQGRVGPSTATGRKAVKVPQRHHDARPNVLWLMADQYRADMLGCAGRHPAIQTPNLDRLAAEGVRFDRAYCTAPVCLPSRASMLSGTHLPRHGGLTNNHAVDSRLPFFPTVLRDAGYRTASIGKTHCGRAGEQIFEYNEFAKDAFGATKPSDVPFDPGIFPECVFIADRVCDDSDRVLYGTYPGPVPTTKSHILADRAISWLYWHDDPRPFFLRVSFDDPHPPVTPAPEFAAMYGPEDVPEEWLEGYEESLAAKCPTVREYAEIKGVTQISREQHRMHAARYMALCTQLDAEIGRVLDALDEYGFADNTLVMFNSDHGHMIGEHGFSHKHYVLYEGVNRIPLIMRWPGRLPADRACTELFDGTDVAATFLDALDCELTGLDGRSMLPAARGEGKGREFVVTQYDDFCFSITTPTHKLIRYDSDPGDVGELYDLEQDPLERHNRWTDPALAGTRDALLAQLAHWRRDMETEARNQ